MQIKYNETRFIKEIIFYIREEVRQMLFLPREEGQGLVEYALILVLVAIVVIVILALLGPSIADIFSQIITVI